MTGQEEFSTREEGRFKTSIEVIGCNKLRANHKMTSFGIFPAEYPNNPVIGTVQYISHAAERTKARIYESTPTPDKASVVHGDLS